MEKHNSFCFFCLCFSYIIGGLFYYIHGWFFVDELIVSLIFIYYIFFNRRQTSAGRYLKWVLGIAIFYLIYSLLIHVTNREAVFRDFLQECKPLISFFVVYALKPVLTKKQKKILKFFALLFSGVSVVLFVYGGEELFGHRAFYGHIMLISALLYLFASKRQKKDIIVFFVILALGLLCTRSKYFGEFALALMLVFVLKPPIRFNIKYLFFGAITILVVVFAAWEKFSVYFVQGLDDDSIARNMLYVRSVDVIKDYFPFGSGFGSYGVDASRVYYSPLYYRYGLSNIYGMTEDYNEFIADTYFPVVIAQFGLLGIFLLFKFVEFIIKRAGDAYAPQNRILYAMIILIISSILIESVAGPMFVMTTGVPILILLAYCLCDIEKNKQVHKKIES